MRRFLYTEKYNINLFALFFLFHLFIVSSIHHFLRRMKNTTSAHLLRLLATHIGTKRQTKKHHEFIWEGCNSKKMKKLILLRKNLHILLQSGKVLMKERGLFLLSILGSYFRKYFPAVQL